MLTRERDDNASNRAAEAYRLWLRGYSFRRIASDLGYRDPSAAHKAWKRARAAQLAPPDLEAERQRERDRLEIAYAGIAQRVEEGDDWAIDRAMSIADRKAKLLGLDIARDAQFAAVHYTKRIILEDRTPSTGSDPLATLASESEPAA